MNSRPTILILDDEEFIIQSLGKTVQKFGYAVVVCLHPAEAMSRMEKTKVDLVISDLRMPARNGIEFLNQVKNNCPNTARALLVGPEDREIAVQTVIRQIADWFIDKPWDEQIVKITILMLLRCQQTVRANNLLKEILKEQEDKDECASSI